MRRGRRRRRTHQKDMVRACALVHWVSLSRGATFPSWVCDQCRDARRLPWLSLFAITVDSGFRVARCRAEDTVGVSVPAIATDCACAGTCRNIRSHACIGYSRTKQVYRLWQQTSYVILRANEGYSYSMWSDPQWPCVHRNFAGRWGGDRRSRWRGLFLCPWTYTITPCLVAFAYTVRSVGALAQLVSGVVGVTSPWLTVLPSLMGGSSGVVSPTAFRRHPDYDNYKWLAAYLALPKVYPLLATHDGRYCGRLWCTYCRRPLRTHFRGPFCLDRAVPGEDWTLHVCSLCRWKMVNREVPMLDAFRLWPPRVFPFCGMGGRNWIAQLLMVT